MVEQNVWICTEEPLLLLQEKELGGRGVYFLFRKKLAEVAPSPPTNAPIKAVTRIIATDEPPRGNISATFFERICSFFTSIHNASRNHNKNTPKNPARKALPLLNGINRTAINAAMAILHHGKYKPPTKESKAVSMIATRSFIDNILPQTPKGA